MNKKIEKHIACNIGILRVKKGLTQDMLAAKLQVKGCDITRSAIAKIEAGQRHIHLDEIILLRQILDCTYEDIFNIDGIELE